MLRRNLEKAKKGPAIAPPPPTIGATSPSEPEEEWWSRTTDEVVAGMRLLGDPIVTGCDFIDREMRHGGIPPGKVFGIGGPPFTGKSQLFAQIMRKVSESFRCYTLMADAGTDDTAVSVSALLGFEKKDVEKKPAEYAPRIREILATSTLWHVNPEHPKATLRWFLDWVSEDCPAQETPVVFVDSAQAIRHGASEDEQGDLSDAEITGLTCRRFVKRRRALCFLSSKANRAFFRNRNKADNATALSSFMGGDYEYTYDAAIVLSRPDKESGFVGVEWAKNRLGNPNPKETALRWDSQIQSLVELDKSEIEAEEINSRQNSIGPVKNKIREALKGKPPISKNAIRELIGGDRGTISHAIDQLVSEKVLDQAPFASGTGFRYTLILRD